MLNKLKRIFSANKNVVYDDSFFQQAWFENWESLKLILKALVEFKPEWKKVLDFGCGPGIMIDFMTDNSFDYFGCDYSQEAKTLYLEHYGKHPDRYLSRIPEKPEFDLFVSFDVFEHLTDEEVDQVLRQITTIPWLLVNISRDKGVPGHVNIKKDKDWIRFFQERGFQFQVEETKAIRSLYTQLRPGNPDLWNKNMFILKNQNESQGNP